MKTVLISYDLCKPYRDYAGLIDAIKGYGTWGKLTESAWLIRSSDGCVAVRDRLKSHMDSNDRLFVGTMQGEGAWSHVLCDSSWLKQTL
ncbi:MAG: hypothetical protein C4521_04850 [Actinobacteria bacterium]|nr:MAG: hypothetical protein C4521_04850 [Actinomycetota bacterium]